MFLKSIFGSANDRYLKKFKRTILKINELESSYELLSDNELRDKTQEYKTRIQNGESLESILPEAFASVREASKRVLGMRPFDVQLMGGIILNNVIFSILELDECSSNSLYWVCHNKRVQSTNETLFSGIIKRKNQLGFETRVPIKWIEFLHISIFVKIFIISFWRLAIGCFI